MRIRRCRILINKKYEGRVKFIEKLAVTLALIIALVSVFPTYNIIAIIALILALGSFVIVNFFIIFETKELSHSTDTFKR